MPKHDHRYRPAADEFVHPTCAGQIQFPVKTLFIEEGF
jgi:hypothetical protein